MRKKNLVIILLLILILIVGIVLLMGLGKNKVHMTAEEFKTLMERKGYTISDATNQFSEDSHIQKVYIAMPSDYSYQIEFYEFTSKEYANSAYNDNKSNFRASKDYSSSEAMEENIYYSKYGLATEDKYKVVSTNGNTMIYFVVNIDQKEAMGRLLREIGY